MAYTPELLAEKKRIEQHVKIGSEALYLTKAECMENGPTVEDIRSRRILLPLLFS